MGREAFLSGEGISGKSRGIQWLSFWDEARQHMEFQSLTV